MLERRDSASVVHLCRDNTKKSLPPLGGDGTPGGCSPAVILTHVSGLQCPWLRAKTTLCVLYWAWPKGPSVLVARAGGDQTTQITGGHAVSVSAALHSGQKGPLKVPSVQ
uniref:Uncharacterized protein n=1 Tax=Eutreptiella gymnastica TaxID=73025 RepID=A0A7S1HS63_9EUGL